MGCDIHWIVEVQNPDTGRWVGMFSDNAIPLECAGHEVVNNKEARYIRVKQPVPVLGMRDYAFFAKLAGVRGPGPDPIGMPDDASDLTRLKNNQWGEDGHSHTHMPLREFFRRYVEAHPEVGAEIMRDKIKPARHPQDDALLQHFMGWLYDDFKDARIVMWFDS